MSALFDAAPTVAVALATFVGILVGSFLNVVILRLPPRLSWAWRRDAREILELPSADAGTDHEPPDLIRTPSHCPVSGARLAWWENIPLVSYVLLRGKSRSAGTPIPLQYPIVELLTGIASALVIWQFGPTLAGAVALVFTWFLIAASGIDLRTTLLPDQLTLPLLWLGLLAAVGGLFVAPNDAIIGAAAGYLALWSVYWAFKLLTGKEGMGYGDFKLLAALGAFCGWQGLLPIVLLSALIGAIVGGTWLAIKGRDQATPIPFGPFLAGAGWIQFMYGDAIIGAYMSMSGLGR